MASPKFYLRDPNIQDRSTAIIFRVYHNGKAYKYGTGKSIIPALWDQKSQRPVKKKSIIDRYKSNNPHLSIDLDNIRVRIENIIRDYQKVLNQIELEGRKFDFAEIKSVLDSNYKQNKKVIINNLNLNEYIEHFIQGIENGTILIAFGPGKGQRYAKGTIKNYQGFQVQFEEFQKSIHRKLNFDDVDIKVYDQFVDFFTGKAYSINTIGRHIKSLKVILRQSKELGLHENTEFERRSFETLKAKTTTIYLSEDEIKKIADLDLSQLSHLELARDVFLIGCFTALRYSDYSRIKPNHISDKRSYKTLEMVIQKTGGTVFIPIKPELEKILKKYDYSIPKTWEQKVNKYIKEVGRIAGIDKLVELEKVKGGQKYVVKVPKYELIKTHTARRSAATNMYLAGIPSIDIMKITGHSTEKNFLKYIRVSKEQTADRLALHPYFQNIFNAI